MLEVKMCRDILLESFMQVAHLWAKDRPGNVREWNEGRCVGYKNSIVMLTQLTEGFAAGDEIEKELKAVLGYEF